MQKILTVSIAAYNAENFIRKAINSLIDHSIMQYLEVFVVDDGGTDKTLDIAKEYEIKYPGVFYAVHKENGGYGSTVNYSVKYARGKYFKLLDGDDWYQTSELVKLIEYLRKAESDVIVLPYLKGSGKDMRKISIKGEKANGKLLIKDIGKLNTWIGNPSICYKTSVLKSSNLELPKHMLYTDSIYSIIPFAYASTIEFLPFTVYCYQVGRNEQSVSVKNKIKHIDTLICIANYLNDFFVKNRTNKNYEYICRYAAINNSVVFRAMLSMERSKETLAKIIKFDQDINSVSLEIYREIANSSKTGRLIGIMRKTNYWAYWLYVISPLYRKQLREM